MGNLEFSSISVDKAGTVSILWKEILPGETKNLRLTFSAGSSVEDKLASVIAYVEANKLDPIVPEDIAKLKAQIAASWTPANIAPVTAEVLAATQVQRDAEAQHAQAIKDAAEREAAANIAKTKAEAAEALAKEATDKANAATQAMNDALAKQAASEKAAADKKAFDAAVAQKAAELTFKG